MQKFKVHSNYQPAGDQPKAIQKLSEGILNNEHNQTLLGVTGSGKTFTMANVIQTIQKPTLIMAPNKILAAQLYGEMKDFFPNNAVEYFVSYYDYYQPEAYIPRSDTYIEKTAQINEQIDRLRHSATRALLERTDVIIVASVSCIYGLGDVETYSEMTFSLSQGETYMIQEVARKLVDLQYNRNDLNFIRGTFRIRGDILEIFPTHYDSRAWRISFFGDEIETIYEFDPLTGKKFEPLESIKVFANSHYVTPKPTIQQAIKNIKNELKDQLITLKEQNKLLEYERLKNRTEYDIEMLITTNMCPGIENYSRYLSGRNPGEPPPTLFEYLPKDALLIVDESHVAVPQIRGMYRGDQARKKVLSEHGFRLPSCLDNRPLKFEEWDQNRPHTVFVSATPGPFELEVSGHHIVEQVVRPTGLVDPVCIVKKCEGQIDDLMHECRVTIEKGLKILVTTLTKKMAERLCEYFSDIGLRVQYLHSDIDTLKRIEIIQALRQNEFDILIGINLLREGLDIPECGLVAILDADKEGFLRSETSLIQTIGRAARNAEGRVILYANHMTESLKAALSETDRRRNKQLEYNKKHNITPKTIIKSLNKALNDLKKEEEDTSKVKVKKEDNIDSLKAQMMKEAKNLNFEKAAKIRDQIQKIQNKALRF